MNSAGLTGLEVPNAVEPAWLAPVFDPVCRLVWKELDTFGTRLVTSTCWPVLLVFISYLTNSDAMMGLVVPNADPA